MFLLSQDSFLQLIFIYVSEVYVVWGFGLGHQLFFLEYVLIDFGMFLLYLMKFSFLVHCSVFLQGTDPGHRQCVICFFSQWISCHISTGHVGNSPFTFSPYCCILVCTDIFCPTELAKSLVALHWHVHIVSVFSDFIN